jgi:NADPH:quinone reductase-like Zn-dependent oxidoreductase
MKAAVCREYGVLRLEETDPLAVREDGVRVRVRAAALNALDWYFASGTPYLFRLMTGLLRPGRSIPGVDFAGTVESVGSRVRSLRPGDEVFGVGKGTLAALVCAPEDGVAPKPAGVTFEQAAATPVAGLTALQGLRDHGQIRPGHKVLIHGAAGGVGTFAVQVAKALGAEVTGVCSPNHVDLVRSLGADRVVDRSREDFTQGGERYDLMLDIAGGRPWSACRRVLAPDARFVLAGGPRTNRWFGPIGHLLGTQLAATGDRRKVISFVAKPNRQDLLALGELLATVRVTPVIAARYELRQANEALRHQGEGHPEGKVVVTM